MNVSILKELAKYHIDWLKMAKSIGSANPEDLVQDMYLRLNEYTNEKIMKNGKPNTLYVWVTLRNMHYTEVKKYQPEQLDKTLHKIPDEVIEHLGESRIHERIEEEINNWHWYDKMLFDLYRKSGKSLRTLETETGLTFSSINNTLRNCKKRLIENVGESYQDYINKDYELI